MLIIISLEYQIQIIIGLNLFSLKIMQEKINYCRNINYVTNIVWGDIKMNNIKNLLTTKIMRLIGSIALFLGVLAMVPNSLLLTHQPKCPDELLK